MIKRNGTDSDRKYSFNIIHTRKSLNPYIYWKHIGIWIRLMLVRGRHILLIYYVQARLVTITSLLVYLSNTWVYSRHTIHQDKHVPMVTLSFLLILTKFMFIGWSWRLNLFLSESTVICADCWWWSQSAFFAAGAVDPQL